MPRTEEGQEEIAWAIMPERESDQFTWWMLPNAAKRVAMGIALDMMLSKFLVPMLDRAELLDAGTHVSLIRDIEKYVELLETRPSQNWSTWIQRMRENLEIIRMNLYGRAPEWVPFLSALDSSVQELEEEAPNDLAWNARGVASLNSALLSIALLAGWFGIPWERFGYVRDLGDVPFSVDYQEQFMGDDPETWPEAWRSSAENWLRLWWHEVKNALAFRDPRTDIE